MGSCSIFKREGNSWVFQTKLVADERESGDRFGKTVSIDGDYLVVGVPYKHIDLQENVGAAYIFKRENDNWIQQAKLVADGGLAHENFGDSVDISGSTVIVGTMYQDQMVKNGGTAFIFEREGNNWTQKAHLYSHDVEMNDNFGVSVSISGDYAAIGASGDDDKGSGSGSVYIFKKENNTWTNQTKIIIEEGTQGDNFGFAVSISEDYLVVGAPSQEYQGPEYTVWAGVVHIFKRENETWNQISKHVGTNPNHGDNFGKAVSIQGRNFIIGAFNEAEFAISAGASYISMICDERFIGDYCESCFEDIWTGSDCLTCKNSKTVHYTSSYFEKTDDGSDICSFDNYRLPISSNIVSFHKSDENHVCKLFQTCVDNIEEQISAEDSINWWYSIKGIINNQEQELFSNIVELKGENQINYLSKINGIKLTSWDHDDIYSKKVIQIEFPVTKTVSRQNSADASCYCTTEKTKVVHGFIEFVSNDLDTFIFDRKSNKFYSKLQLPLTYHSKEINNCETDACTSFGTQNITSDEGWSTFELSFDLFKNDVTSEITGEMIEDKLGDTSSKFPDYQSLNDGDCVFGCGFQVKENQLLYDESSSNRIIISFSLIIFCVFLTFI